MLRRMRFFRIKCRTYFSHAELEKSTFLFISILAFVHAVIKHNEKGFTVSDNINGEKITKRKMLPYNLHLHMDQTCRKQCRC